ncbi:MAG: tRNA (N(6)-L-threonylcarbamoyladenosine(37)-C(2))-methylthiotransferase MtaB [Phycisphaerae bacterium]
MMKRKYLITTLGCKVNQYESEHLRGVLESYGLSPTSRENEADVAIVNTCAVTAAASRKSRQSLRRLSREGATSVIAVGCAATEDAARLAAIPGVSAVFGHDTDTVAELRAFLEENFGGVRSDRAALHDQPDHGTSSSPHLPEHSTSLTALRDQQEQEQPDVRTEANSFPTIETQPGRQQSGTRNRVGASNSLAINAPEVQSGNKGWMMPANATSSQADSDGIVPQRLPIVNQDQALNSRIDVFHGHQRAFLKVQDGCDAFCSYCIIPRLRPSLRSKPIDVAIDEARSLVASGHQEIIITGIFLGAYGRETAIRKRFGAERSPLAALVRGLAQVEGLKRLRLSSLEPGDVDEELLDVLASEPVCVPHLHLPLQAGSAEILRRMNRQYTRDDFDAMIDRTRSRLDRPAISTDIIVGFPGETDADFEATLEASRRAAFVKIHAFPFSPRERTAAARWQKDFVQSGLARDRMNELGKLESELSTRFRRQFIGDVERVLIEQDDDPFDVMEGTVVPRQGRTDRYFPVHFEDAEASVGDLVDVRIDRVTPTRTHGTVIRNSPNRYPLPVLPTLSDASFLE